MGHVELDMCFHDIGMPPHPGESWVYEWDGLQVHVCTCGVASYSLETLYQEWWPEGRVRVYIRSNEVCSDDGDAMTVRRARPKPGIVFDRAGRCIQGR